MNSIAGLKCHPNREPPERFTGAAAGSEEFNPFALKTQKHMQISPHLYILMTAHGRFLADAKRNQGRMC